MAPPTMAVWRARLELLGLLLGVSVLLGGAAHHLLALARDGGETSYTRALRQNGILIDVGFSAALVLALLIVLLPRLVFQWPSSTPRALAIGALVVVAGAALVVGAIGAVQLIGGISEIGVEEGSREVAGNMTEVWSLILLGLGSTAACALALVYSLLGVATITKSSQREVVVPDTSLPPIEDLSEPTSH